MAAAPGGAPDGEVPIPELAAVVGSQFTRDPTVDPRMAARLEALAECERRRDLAGGDFVAACFEQLSAAEHHRDGSLRVVGGPTMEKLQKAERKRDRAQKTFVREALDNLGNAEAKVLQSARAAGGSVPLLTSEIAQAVSDGKLDELYDRYMTEPMARAAVLDAMGVGPDQPPLLDDPTPPPSPPAAIEPPGFPPPPPPPPPPGGPCPEPSPPPQPYYAASGCLMRPVWNPAECRWTWIETHCPPPPVPPPSRPGDPGKPTSPPPPPVPPPGSFTSPADPCSVGTVRQCGRFTITRPIFYWYSLTCLPGCEAEICEYVGDTTPAFPPGARVSGPHSAAMSPTAATAWANSCFQSDLPPVVVPPPPPGVPPTPSPPPPVPGVPPEPGRPQPAPPGRPQPVRQLPTPPPGDDAATAAYCRLIAERIQWHRERQDEPGTDNTFWNEMDGQFRDVGGIGGAIISGISVLLQAAGNVTTPLYSLLGLFEPGTVQGLASPIGAAEWAQRLTGAPFDYLTTHHRYALQSHTPLLMPTFTDANTQYLSGEIDRNGWECLVKLNGVKPGPAFPTVHAQRTRPGVEDTLRLWRKGLLSDADFREQMRQLGVLEDRDRDGFVKATEQTPPASDLIRYMVRDADDPKAVEAFGLGIGFGDKFQAQIRDWAKAAGVTEKQMLYEWYSHWMIPSDTRLFEAIRRLRPGRVQSQPFNNRDGTRADLNPAPVTIEDVRYALQVNDMAPGWVDRIIALSYVPINLTEIKALEKNGVINEAEVVERLQDIGKSPADSLVLAELVRRDNARMLANESGAWTRRRIGKEYTAGTIGREEAKPQLIKIGLSPEKADDLFNQWDAIRRAEARGKCIKGVRRRYFTAEIDEGDALTLLQGYGVPRLTAGELVEGWKCERHSRSREPRVSWLQKWWLQGFITDVEFLLRLKRLGYPDADANRILASAARDEQDRRAKAAAAAAEKARKEAERRQRELDRLAAQERRRRQTSGGGGSQN